MTGGRLNRERQQQKQCLLDSAPLRKLCAYEIFSFESGFLLAGSFLFCGFVLVFGFGLISSSVIESEVDAELVVVTVATVVAVKAVEHLSFVADYSLQVISWFVSTLYLVLFLVV